ncbi:hypothetical protein [Pseudomonas sp. DSP3-2-2]|uniref:hypothetical protein n=1 Tax=unclassified Pseudomonas TaxID=196821 RepID=UPI003CED47BA
MLSPANQATFTLDIAQVEHQLRVLSFTDKEAVSPSFSLCIRAFELHSRTHKEVFHG